MLNANYFLKWKAKTNLTETFNDFSQAKNTDVKYAFVNLSLSILDSDYLIVFIIPRWKISIGLGNVHKWHHSILGHFWPTYPNHLIYYIILFSKTLFAWPTYPRLWSHLWMFHKYQYLIISCNTYFSLQQAEGAKARTGISGRCQWWPIWQYVQYWRFSNVFRHRSFPIRIFCNEFQLGWGVKILIKHRVFHIEVDKATWS